MSTYGLQVGPVEGGVLIRTVRDPDHHLFATADEWVTFRDAVKNGHFDVVTPMEDDSVPIFDVFDSDSGSAA